MRRPFPKLAYTWVPGQEPVVVFIHGLGADGRCFSGALNSPELKGRALLIPDLVGFGNSPRPDSLSYTMEAQAEFLCDLCQSLGVSQIAIVAHSMGGAVGILFAEKWPDTVTHFANAVGNLVPEDCFYSRPLIEMGWEAFSAKGFEEFKAEIAAQASRSDRPPSTYLESLQKTTAQAMYRSGSDLVRVSDEGDLLARFLRLSCHKLYLQDADSRMTSHLEKALHQAGVPILVIPNSGHSLMEDNPTGFYHTIARFLDQE